MTSNSSRRPRARGQTIVLGCMTLLTMALMMMASYSIGNAVHQKIALQSHADSEAYSIAVTEARYFNVLAYYNRGIVATLVAQMSLHAWMAVATGDVDQLHDGDALMAEIVIFEISEGCRMIAPWVPHPMAWLHCPHLIEAIWDGVEFFMGAMDWDDKLSGMEDDFNKGVEAITKANKTLNTRQVTIIATGAIQVAGKGDVTTALQKNAPNANFSLPVAALNEMQYLCALEGAVDSTCVNLPGFVNPYRAASSKSDRSKVLASAANAARPLFTDGSIAGLAATAVATRRFAGDFDINAKEPNNYLTSGSWDMNPLTQSLKGHVGDSTPGLFNLYMPANNTDDEANNAAAGGSGAAWIKNWGWMKPSHGHAPWNPLPFGGGVASDSGGGTHGFYYWFAPSTQHSSYKGFTTDPCLKNPNYSCFINYRGLTDKAKDFGQPHVYAGASQNLRLYDAKVGDTGDRKLSDGKTPPPWELNKNGKVEVKFVKGKTTTVNYVPRGNGYAVSKAMVYFHQLGDWSVPPNFFDPFWRGKLHFFSSRGELNEVMLAAGDGLGSVGPYDGSH